MHYTLLSSILFLLVGTAAHAISGKCGKLSFEFIEAEAGKWKAELSGRLLYPADTLDVNAKRITKAVKEQNGELVTRNGITLAHQPITAIRMVDLKLHTESVTVWQSELNDIYVVHDPSEAEMFFSIAKHDSESNKLITHHSKEGTACELNP